MALTNAHMRYYDHNVLRLPQDKRQTLNAQVDRLIDSVRQQLHQHTEFRISRVIKAGSFAKHTILRKLAISSTWTWRFILKTATSAKKPTKR